MTTSSPTSSAETPLLSVRNLTIEFQTEQGPIQPVRNVSFDLMAGQTLAIVGESGSGKSTLVAAINGLLAENGRIAEGEVMFEGLNLTRLDETAFLGLRGQGIGLVPQDPMTNLNPIQRVGRQIGEALEIHGHTRGKATHARTVELLTMVGIPEPARRARQYPHELSGGMRQRVLIAMGLACEPKLLIADEPTSALDVTVQRVILDELAKLTARLGTATIFVTHDLSLASERADEVLVLYRGDPVEQGPSRDVLRAPSHHYTADLIAAAPRIDGPLLPEAPELNMQRPLVELVNLRKTYPHKGSGSGEFVALEGSSFVIRKGQTVSVVGESGSGKSTTARLLLGLETPTGGNILFEGRDIGGLRGSAHMAFRRRVQPVFQNPLGALDPRFTIEQSIEEPMLLHGLPAAQRRKRVDELLDQVSLPVSMKHRRPGEISGGQAQRVAIARALSLNPDLVVLDEAVSALDVLVQAQILDLLADLQQTLGLAYLFISHDLAVVRQISHEVHVMSKGRIVESGKPADIFNAPADPYTRALISAVPRAA
jgi:peptide/nickel transport system ATP-binding protein